jgi:predicted DNA-binding protein
MNVTSSMATSIRRYPATEQRLDHLASPAGRTRARCLRKLVANGVAAAAMARVRTGEEKTFSAQPVRQDLGLDGWLATPTRPASSYFASSTRETPCTLGTLMSKQA